MRIATLPRLAASLNLLALASGVAHAGCAISQPAAGQLVISTSVDGSCETALLRDSLRYAILVSESAAFPGGSRLAQGALANQQRTTSSNLFRLGTAPSAVPPPTRFVSPGLGARP